MTGAAPCYPGLCSFCRLPCEAPFFGSRGKRGALVGWLVGWFVWLAGWLAGCLVGWVGANFLENFCGFPTRRQKLCCWLAQRPTSGELICAWMCNPSARFCTMAFAGPSCNLGKQCGRMVSNKRSPQSCWCSVWNEGLSLGIRCPALDLFSFVIGSWTLRSPRSSREAP